MDQLLHETNELLSWYREEVRNILEDVAKDRIDEFDRQAKRLEKIAKLSDVEVAACFLGKSGVGKSTLLNALVADQQSVLPAGGVGPLTAQAIEVAYSEVPRFQVAYHGIGPLNRLLFALDRWLEREKNPAAAMGDAEGPDENEDGAPAVSTQRKQLEGQARLMITGNQNSSAPLEYLVDCLRVVAGRNPKWGTVIASEDKERVQRLAAIIAKSKRSESYTKDGATNAPAFIMDLRDHAAGFLAPLIKQIELGWPSPMLKRGIRLVDLPGLGISGDIYRKITEQWVRDQARAVCLVVDRSMIDEASADLLRTSGFMNRLLHSMDDPEADPVSLMIIVVKVDEVAHEHFRQEREVKPVGYRKRHEHLADLRARMPQSVQVQLHDELRKLIEGVDGPAREASEAALHRIHSNLQVHVLTAREYVNLLDEDEPSFIRDAEESGIPQLKHALTELVEQRQQLFGARLIEASADFRNSLSTALRALEAQWKDLDGESAETERLKEGLQGFLPKLKRELYARQGSFHSFLKEGLPDKIESLIAAAAAAAEKDMRKYVNRLGEVHWATLKAAVKRGGTFVGSRHIDLPRDFSLLFDGQVAPIWGENVIQLVRKRTSGLANDYVELIEQVVAWAEEQGARSQAKVVAALSEQIRADARTLASVGREGAEELREQVKARLLKSIASPIQKRCSKFVGDNSHIGIGVKQRILKMCEELVPDVISAAQTPTTRILKDSFSTVESEIREHFDKYPDPLQAAEQAIVKVHGDAERRSMAQRRKRMLEQITHAIAATPKDGAQSLVGVV